MTLQTVLSKIADIANETNAAVLHEFHDYMVKSGAGEHHLKNELYVSIIFAKHLNDTTFFDITKQAQIIEFLNTKKKLVAIDPDERWKTTWNDYLDGIKHFIRWLYNQRGKDDLSDPLTWETPEFVKIKKLKVKRLSPYADSEKWSREELMAIIPYSTHLRNKAALGLFWDLDARNHEVTKLEIRNLHLTEKYGEGEIPFQTKTGGGPILLTMSFPYVRDWLNAHPFKDNPRSRVICSLKNGAPIEPTAMWSMMKQLRGRIARLLRKGVVTDPEERIKLENLLRTKKWNPYCIRHSAITYDSDTLAEFALRKKVRWSMNSKQPGRYVSRRMGQNLKMQILEREGIEVAGSRIKPVVRQCPRCELVNSLEMKYCTKCAYPLSVSAYDEIKAKEQAKEKEIADLKKHIEKNDRQNEEFRKEILEAIRDKVRKGETAPANMS